MKIFGSMILLMSLSSCSYRYGTGYFTLEGQEPPAHIVPSAVKPIESATVNDEDCAQTIEKLEITNKLDHQNNTITTTAVTTRDTSSKCP